MEILTANRLADGDVVFLTSEGDWSIDINEASIAQTIPEVQKLESIGAQADADAHVIGCYLVDVIQTNGVIEATHYREIMRTKGPTVRCDLGKQAKVYGSCGQRSGKSINQKFWINNSESKDGNNEASDDGANIAFVAGFEQEKNHVSV